MKTRTLAQDINDALTVLNDLLTKADNEIQRDDLPGAWDKEIEKAVEAIQYVASEFGDAGEYLEHWTIAEEMLGRIEEYDCRVE